MIRQDKFKRPEILRPLPSWVESICAPRFVTWRFEGTGDAKPTKVPYISMPAGGRASVSDPTTWRIFADARRHYDADPTMSGIGMVLVPGGPTLCVIDLDGAIDLAGIVADWARALIEYFTSYTELSVSRTGIHIFLTAAKSKTFIGKSAFKGLGDSGKSAIEIYDQKRYIAITGWPVVGFEHLAAAPPQPRQHQLDALCQELWPDAVPMESNTAAPMDNDAATAAIVALTADMGAMEMAVREIRCRAYVQKMPPAISGEGGHAATFRVACEIFRFGLNTETAWSVLQAFNENCCFPAWSYSELAHKLRQGRSTVIGNNTFGVRLGDKSNK